MAERDERDLLLYLRDLRWLDVDRGAGAGEFLADNLPEASDGSKAPLDAFISGGKLMLSLDRAIGGNDLYAVSICSRNNLYGGTFDGLGDNGRKVAFVKSTTNMGNKANTKGGPYWAGSSSADRKRFRPIAGETMWVAIVDKSTAARSTVAEIVWKE